MGKRSIPAATVFICSALLVATGWIPLASPVSASRPAAGPSTAQSAKALGGMKKLIAAAKKEGTLNVIALPADWANYGQIISTFQKKYGIKINSDQPTANSQEEINAALRLKGRDTAPDVFDLTATVALANTNLFTPYRVTNWNDIPSNAKAKNAKWFSDYGGYSSIGYDPSKVPAPKTVKDLLKPAYRGKVALNGDPTKSGAGFNGVMLAAIGNGGSANNIAPGVEFFKKLKAAGNFLLVDPTAATVQSGATPVVIDWEYVNAAYTKEFAGKVTWKTVVPKNDVVGDFYIQAINKDAPHPAAARLWEEFLYSNQGQLLWLKGGSRPVRLQAMINKKAVSAKVVASLPKVSGKPVILTQAQKQKAQAYLQANWSAAIGG